MKKFQNVLGLLGFEWFYIKDFSVICRFAPLLCTCLCPVHGGKAGSRYQGLQHLQV